MSTILFYKVSDYYGCFSNFYSAEITLKEQRYCCNEQYIMYQKAVLFGDKEIAEKIMKVTNPVKIKQYGRQVKGFKEDVWGANVKRIAYECNLAKFSQHPTLKSILLSTGEALLAEASPTDR